jgi:1-aminocyclopropane-1-carboxylate deaminase/D-cysteine desulfhydrase-like pyridoxal-dependent ACC family enzyme
LDRLLGAEIIWAEVDRRDEVLAETFAKAELDGRQPYLIPYGGSNPIGAVAYAFALQEMVNQDFQPDWIVFPTSSGGTQAGLVVGAKLFGYMGQILGISVDQPEEVLSARVRQLAEGTGALFEESMSFSENDILINAAYLGGGYGVLGPNEVEAIHMFARLEGIILDPVYTGRAGAGLIDLIRSDFFSARQQVLFWHTGGAPALFADRYQVI